MYAVDIVMSIAANPVEFVRVSPGYKPLLRSTVVQVLVYGLGIITNCIVKRMLMPWIEQ